MWARFLSFAKVPSQHRGTLLLSAGLATTGGALYFSRLTGRLHLDSANDDKKWSNDSVTRTSSVYFSHTGTGSTTVQQQVYYRNDGDRRVRVVERTCIPDGATGIARYDFAQSGR